MWPTDLGTDAEREAFHPNAPEDCAWRRPRPSGLRGKAISTLVAFSMRLVTEVIASVASINRWSGFRRRSVRRSRVTGSCASCAIPRNPSPLSPPNRQRELRIDRRHSTATSLSRRQPEVHFPTGPRCAAPPEPPARPEHASRPRIRTAREKSPPERPRRRQCDQGPNWRGNTATTEGRFFTVSGIPTARRSCPPLVEQILDVGGRCGVHCRRKQYPRGGHICVVGHARENKLAGGADDADDDCR